MAALEAGDSVPAPSSGDTEARLPWSPARTGDTRSRGVDASRLWPPPRSEPDDPATAPAEDPKLWLPPAAGLPRPAPPCRGAAAPSARVALGDAVLAVGVCRCRGAGVMWCRMVCVELPCEGVLATEDEALWPRRCGKLAKPRPPWCPSVDDWSRGGGVNTALGTTLDAPLVGVPLPWSEWPGRGGGDVMGCWLWPCGESRDWSVELPMRAPASCVGGSVVSSTATPLDDAPRPGP